MSRLWIILVAVPLTFVAGLPSGAANGCDYAGGETEATVMVPAAPGPGDGFYLHAEDSDPTKSGLYAEDNGKPGLQVTNRVANCGSGPVVMRKADQLLLEYFT